MNSAAGFDIYGSSILHFNRINSVTQPFLLHDFGSNNANQSENIFALISDFTVEYDADTAILADSLHFVFIPLYCRKYKKLLRQEKSTEKKNKYKKGDKHEVCTSFWIHYYIEKP